MPIHMRMRKLRGPHMKKSMPFEPFRTHTQPVNISALESRFDAGTEVTLELMKANGLGTRKDVPVKVLAKGELTKALTVHAHAFSASARERIEAAGGTCTIDRGLAAHAPCNRRRARGASTRIGRPERALRASLPRAAEPKPMLSTILNAFQVADIRKKIAFTAGMLLIYRLGSHVPVPGVNLTAVNNIQKSFGGGGILSYLNLFSGGGLSQTRDLRAGDHAVHHLLDHPAAAAGGGAVAGEALQGRRGRAGAHHPVHPLPDRRPRVRPVDRLRVPVPQPAGESRRKRDHALRRCRTSS